MRKGLYTIFITINIVITIAISLFCFLFVCFFRAIRAISFITVKCYPH